MEAAPEHSPQGGQNAGEAVGPLAHEGKKTEKNVRQQGGPDLPLNRVFAVSEKITDLQDLFDLLEECLYRPTTFIKIADTAGSPRGVIGDEGHLREFIVHLDDRLYPAELLLILPAGTRPRQLYKIVA